MGEFDQLRKAVEAGDDVVPVPRAQLSALLSRVGLIERAEDALHELLTELNDEREAEIDPELEDRCDYNFHVSVAEFTDAGLCCNCGEQVEHPSHVPVYVCASNDGQALEAMADRTKWAEERLAARAKYEAEKKERSLLAPKALKEDDV